MNQEIAQRIKEAYAENNTDYVINGVGCYIKMGINFSFGIGDLIKELEDLNVTQKDILIGLFECLKDHYKK